MIEELRVKDYEIEVRRRARQRNMNLTVRADGRIRVSCNLRRSKSEISAFVLSCHDFIQRRREHMAALDLQFPRPKFLSGESVMYFGRPVPLEVIWSWKDRVVARRRVGGDVFAAEVVSGFEIVAPLNSSVDERRAALSRVYKAEARSWFEARAKFFSGLMGLHMGSLSVRGQRTLWGSCTGVADISLNWKLLCCPVELIDYVVVHELSHIRHRNHSAAFWDFVSRFDPNYKEHRRALKTFEPVIARLF